MKNNITQQDIDKWIKLAYYTACKHGFHDKEYSDGHRLMLMVTEISEAVEADRKNKHADKEDVDEFYFLFKTCRLFDDLFKKLFEQFVKDTVEDELADVCIRIFDFAGLKGIKVGIVPDDDIKDSKGYGRIRKLTFTDFCFRCTGTIISMYDDSYDDFTELLTAIIVYCDIHDIELKKHIELKMKYNELRAFKNGKNY